MSEHLRTQSPYSSPYYATCRSSEGVTFFAVDASGIGSKATGRKLADQTLQPLKQYGCVISLSTPSSAPRTSNPAPDQPDPIPTHAPGRTTTPSTPSEGKAGLVTATTRLQWGGTRCISVVSAHQDDRTRTVDSRLCSDDGTWVYTVQVSSGEYVGGDPIMGDADWIACQLYLGDRLEFSDRADAGDGTDVNCLRTLN